MIEVFDLINPIDSSILLFIQEHIRNPVLDPVMTFFSLIGNIGIFWILVSFLLMLTKKYRRTGFDILLCIAICYVINNLAVKNTVQRIRPFLFIGELRPMMGALADAGSWSFPSGHTCSSFAAAYALTRGLGRKGALFYIPAVLISLSRLYIGVHYPSDVAAGAIIGTVGAVCVYALSRRYIKFNKNPQRSRRNR